MAMHRDFYSRLEMIATEDSDREDELGASCPSTLRLFLKGGHVINDCQLLDGLNSLDDRSIDVRITTEEDPEKGIVWIVPIDHIVAVRQRFPLEVQRDAARAKGGRA